MKNFKWGTTSIDNAPVHVVLFVSRNKDNKHIENFKERRVSFISHKDCFDLYEDFHDFVNHGQKNELCRMYYSVNARDPQKIYTQLLHFLFDNPNFNLCSIDSKIAGIAAQKECALEKKWMFDFDIDDQDKVREFIKDIIAIDDTAYPGIRRTPHGYAIITNHGFDCRALMDKWGSDVTLKRDDLLCIDWETKPIETFDF